MNKLRRVSLGEITDLSWGDTSVTKKSYTLDSTGFQAFSAAGSDGRLSYFDFDRTGVVLSAIGANAGLTWLATGKWSCIKNTIRFFSNDETVADTRYLYWATKKKNFWPLRGSAQPFISQGDARKVEIDLPPIDIQRGIAATLGVFDDKIESNKQARATLRALGMAQLDLAATRGTVACTLSDVSKSIARGVAPKYADDDPEAAVVINQRCIRDNWVNLGDVRRMTLRKVKPEKKVASGDILVNSTGTGTLGRVARWHEGELFADSHVTIVKADEQKIGPVTLSYLMFSRESEIADMATGSTGQTELSAASLGDLLLDVPRGHEEQLESTLMASEIRFAEYLREEETLTQLRDALLPGLLSGDIRVSEVQEALR